jgi:hypothetical protein
MTFPSVANHPEEPTNARRNHPIHRRHKHLHHRRPQRSKSSRLPRLRRFLPEKSQAVVDDALTTVVSLLNFAALMIYVTADVALYLNGCRIAYCLWWAVGALALGILLIVVAYRGAVAQTRSYGQHIRTAIDLYRFELLKALHLPLPATPWEERALWNRLAAWLYNNDLGAVRGLAYDLGKQDQEVTETEASPSEGEEIIRSLWQRLWGR